MWDPIVNIYQDQLGHADLQIVTASIKCFHLCSYIARCSLFVRCLYSLYKHLTVVESLSQAGGILLLVPTDCKCMLLGGVLCFKSGDVLTMCSDSIAQPSNQLKPAKLDRQVYNTS